MLLLVVVYAHTHAHNHAHKHARSRGCVLPFALLLPHALRLWRGTTWTSRCLCTCALRRCTRRTPKRRATQRAARALNCACTRSNGVTCACIRGDVLGRCATTTIGRFAMPFFRIVTVASSKTLFSCCFLFFSLASRAPIQNGVQVQGNALALRLVRRGARGAAQGPRHVRQHADFVQVGAG